MTLSRLVGERILLRVYISRMRQQICQKPVNFVLKLLIEREGKRTQGLVGKKVILSFIDSSGLLPGTRACKIL